MTRLHPRLEQDCHYICRLELCHLLLMNDSRYPWCILVPDREGITEIHQLADADQQQLMRESSQLARCLSGLFRPDKLNIAAIGNLVPQLHVHHVARYTGDPAWPAPVWGHGKPVPYREAEARESITRLHNAITDVPV
jgi:diadenosine tetraphosphate (Ap4A) HIT family hydrolase